MANFNGFTLPEGAWMPPEMLGMLSELTESELKILMVIMYNNLQAGGSTPTTLRDIEAMTGLSRRGIIQTIQELLGRGLIEREKVGNTFTYSLHLNAGVQNLHPPEEAPEVETAVLDPAKMGEVKILHFSSGKSSGKGAKSALFQEKGVQNLHSPVVKLSKKESINLINSTDSLNLTTVKKLQSAGVYFATAKSLVEKYPAEVIDQHLEYYRFALKQGYASTPGYLVTSLKEEWGAPLGFEEKRADFFGGWGVCEECHCSPCECAELEDEEDIGG